MYKLTTKILDFTFFSKYGEKKYQWIRIKIQSRQEGKWGILRSRKWLQEERTNHVIDHVITGVFLEHIYKNSKLIFTFTLISSSKKKIHIEVRVSFTQRFYIRWNFEEFSIPQVTACKLEVIIAPRQVVNKKKGCDSPSNGRWW